MIAFRDAVEADLPEIVALLADDILGQTREQSKSDLPAAYRTAFAEITAQGGRIILATQGGRVVGCLQFNVLSGLSHLGQRRAQIESVRVERSLRGSGVGTLLMRHAIKEAARSGCGLVQLTSQRQRTAAIRFYVRLGFIESHAGMKLSLRGT